MTFAKEALKSRVILKFPFDVIPDILTPSKLVLEISGSRSSHVWTWCYLNRDTTNRHPQNWIIDPSSRCDKRAAGIAKLLPLISRQAETAGWRPRTIETHLGDFGSFLAWVDREEHANRYDRIFEDASCALGALGAYNEYGKSLVRNGARKNNSVAQPIQTSHKFLQLTHGRNFAESLSLLMSKRMSGSTAVPLQSDSEAYLRIVAQFFDQSVEAVLSSDPMASTAKAADADVSDRKAGGKWDTAIAASLCIAALALADSGANLAQFLGLQFDDEIVEQLQKPEVSTARKRVVKFRAGGKLVPLTFTLATVTRLRKYLPLREWMLKGQQCEALFIAQNRERKPVGIARNFLPALRRHLGTRGLELANISAREWRSHKQDYLVRNEPLPVAAAIMGHSIETALRAYSNGRRGDQADELGDFLESLAKRATEGSRTHEETPTPVGGCSGHGAPVPAASSVPIVPDCKRQEGCLFCKKYRVYADEIDMRKLLSFRYALRKIHWMQGTNELVDQIYSHVSSVLDGLTAELKAKNELLFSRVEVEVDREHKLTPYWAAKMQQLAFLGFA